jgi:hypothetical protein
MTNATRTHFSSEDRAQLIQELIESIPDHRLDYVAGIGLAVDAYDTYQKAVQLEAAIAGITAREFYKRFFPERFMWIRNAGVAVKAFDLLRYGSK